MKYSLAVGVAGFAKTPAVSETGKHDATNSCVSVQDLAVIVRLSWNEPEMGVRVPKSTPLSFLIMSAITTRGGLISLLVVALLPMGFEEIL